MSRLHDLPMSNDARLYAAVAGVHSRHLVRLCRTWWVYEPVTRRQRRHLAVFGGRGGVWNLKSQSSPAIKPKDFAGDGSRVGCEPFFIADSAPEASEEDLEPAVLVAWPGVTLHKPYVPVSCCNDIALRLPL